MYCRIICVIILQVHCIYFSLKYRSRPFTSYTPSPPLRVLWGSAHGTDANRWSHIQCVNATWLGFIGEPAIKPCHANSHHWLSRAWWASDRFTTWKQVYRSSDRRDEAHPGRRHRELLINDQSLSCSLLQWHSSKQHDASGTAEIYGCPYSMHECHWCPLANVKKLLGHVGVFAESSQRLHKPAP